MLYCVEMGVDVHPDADRNELHTIVSTLPLFPYIAVKVTPLAQYPAAIGQGAG